MPWALALGIALAIQTVTAVLSSSVLVSAPLITAAAGVSVEKIGYYASLQTLGSMWFLMSGGALLRRFGPLRALQAGLVLACLAVALVTSAIWPVILAAGFLLGLAYGPLPPASSDILARYSPAHRRSLAFSIKQAGVPVGQAIGGLAVPIIAVAFDWRLAIVAVIVLVLAVAFGAQPWRAEIDAKRVRAHQVSLGLMLSPRNVLQPLRGLRLAPELPWLTYIGFGFAMSQTCFFSFFVPYLTVELGLAITAAGFAYATLQVFGATGRIIAGWIADRLSGRLILVWLGIASTAALLLTAATGPGAPWPLVLALAAFAGAAAISWNGVYLAQVAACVPGERVSEATAASAFFSFTGYVVGPTAFSLLVQGTGSYRLTYAIFAVLPATAVLALLRMGRKAAL